jgi:outer membrane lipoprotein SlyB
MRKRLITALISTGLLFSTATPGMAVVHRQHRTRTYRSRAYARARAARHRRHVKTAKRVGIGAAGGAAVGALAGGGKGAAIGGLVGAGAGALYDRHEKHRGR